MGDSQQSVTTLLGPGQNAVLGIAAGAIETAIDQPMLYWKNASQQGLPFTLQPRLMYRGLVASMANMGVVTGFQFFTVGSVQQLFLRGESRSLTSQEEIGAGFIGGALSGVPCGFMELVMIQQQRFGGGLVGTPVRLAKDCGAMTLTRGISTAAARESVYTAGLLGIAPVLQKYFAANHLDKFGGSFTAAGMAASVCSGLFAGTVTHPIDTVKTCMQGDCERKKFTNIPGTVRTIMAEHGMMGFFRGWGWRTGRMICATFWINEIKNRLAPIMYPELMAQLEK